MKIDKIQVETLKELMHPGGRVVYYPLDDGEKTVIIPKGVAAYVLPTDMLHVSLRGAQVTDHALYDGVTTYSLDAAVRLAPTDEYRVGGKARKYLADGDEYQPLYIDTKLLAYFTNPVLFQKRYAPLGLVTVAEYQLERDRLEVVGYVCPLRVEDEK